MKELNRFGWIILALLTFSCTQSGKGLSTGSESSTTQSARSGIAPSTDSGNGTQYDGKIQPGRYVRAKAGEVCGPQIKNLGEITVTETSAYGKVLDVSTCSENIVQFELASLEHSNFLTGRLGYVEGIYSIPKKDEVDEVWCRKEGSTNSVGFDIVVKADFKNQIFSAITASSVKDSQGRLVESKYEPLNVSRRFEEMDRVRYRADGFDLEIRRRDYNAQTGLMQGNLKFERNGLHEDIRINCRLGGELDTLLIK